MSSHRQERLVDTSQEMDKKSSQEHHMDSEWYSYKSSFKNFGQCFLIFTDFY